MITKTLENNEEGIIFTIDEFKLLKETFEMLERAHGRLISLKIDMGEVPLSAEEREMNLKVFEIFTNKVATTISLKNRNEPLEKDNPEVKCPCCDFRYGYLKVKSSSYGHTHLSSYMDYVHFWCPDCFATIDWPKNKIESFNERMGEKL